MTQSRSARHPVEVLAAEFVERRRRGERPSVTEYTVRYPDLAERIRALFPTVVMMEDLKHGWLPGAAEERVPECLGEYRILREIGRGGMGIVYEAQQESLSRRVAVKVLTTPALLDADRLRRFQREAQTMARLHHTNIVPVFGVGEHEGLPYYAMQFIDGQGLDQVIKDEVGRMKDEKDQPGIPLHPSSFILHPSAVARIGLQVAGALAYAHAQGTFHRDIKPSNLLIDGQGRVWVTDFGLAKLIEQGEGSGPGETPGTLRYMPPERFQGQSDARGDVYSLGLTLYELLTRRPAFDEADRDRLIRQVTQDEPPAPRQCDPAIPRDLETIILKAIARDPKHRYPSARELADDLRRFLEDKPVRARRVGPVERCRRWCRRNPAVAGLTAVAAGLLVLVAVVASVGYVQTRTALNREAVLRAEAEGQRQRAEANLDLALRAFEEMFDQATRRSAGPAGGESELTRPPVVSPEVAALLHNLLKFYDQFGESNRSDPHLQRAIARAYRRGGDIQKRLGQFEQAETAYRRALALYAARTMAFPAEADCTCEEAAIRNELALVLQATGRYAEAEKLHRQALKMLTPRAETAAARFELARTRNLFGSLLWNTGRADEGEQHYRLALELFEGLVRQDPADPDYRLAQARGYRNLYAVLSLKGNHPKARAAHRHAVRILDQLAKDFPDVPDYRYELSEVLMGSPAAGRCARHHQDAERPLRRAVDLTGELAGAFPAVPEYQALRARAFQKLGAFLQASGRSGDAEPFHREAVALHRALVRQFPAVPLYQLYQAEACQSLGTIRLRGGQPTEACSLLNEAIDAQQAFLRAIPGNHYGRLLLACEYQNLAEALRRLGNSEQAEKALGKAAEARAGLGASPCGALNRTEFSIGRVGRGARPTIPCP